MAQHVSNYFIETARHSSHRPESNEEELAMLIYSYKSVFSARFEVMDEVRKKPIRWRPTPVSLLTVA